MKSSKNDTVDKRGGGTALLIIFLIFGLATLLFVFLSKELDIKLVNRVSASIEKGIDYTKDDTAKAKAPQVDSRLVSAVYVLKDGKVSSCFIQIINAYEKNIFFLELPLNSKLSISSDLYKDLLTYAPTLPQYVKLSRASAYFSENYRYEACTRILEENIGVKLGAWYVMNEADFSAFFNKSTGENYTKENFFSIYKEYANVYRSSMSSKERWAYYEIYDKAAFVEKGNVPGQWEKNDFVINIIQTREIIEELKY